MLQAACGLPVYVENDANCMAYAEWKLGAGKGKRHLVCLTLGTGVGSGLIANGELLRGATCSAGELGQTSIDYRGGWAITVTAVPWRITWATGK